MSRNPIRVDIVSIEDLADRDLIAEVEHLLGGLTPVQVAAQFGASLSGVEKRLEKAGRKDLSAVFTTARSAERAAGAQA